MIECAVEVFELFDLNDQYLDTMGMGSRLDLLLEASHGAADGVGKKTDLGCSRKCIERQLGELADHAFNVRCDSRHATARMSETRGEVRNERVAEARTNYWLRS